MAMMTNDKLLESMSAHVSLDMTNCDTVGTITQHHKYNKNDNLASTQQRIHDDFVQSNKTTYFKYKCGRRVQSETYDAQDSLVSAVRYQYIDDEHNNWIQAHTISDCQITHTLTRVLQYDQLQ